MDSLLTLDKHGILAAAVIALLLILLGGFMGIFFFLVLLWFLILSAVATRYGKKKKKMLGVYEESRGWKNVVANGIMPVIVAVAYFVNAHVGFIDPTALVVAYVASVGAVTADKFASEIGVLDGDPIMLFTLKPARKGVSGAVTWLGLAAGLLASMLIGAALVFEEGFPIYMLVVIISGFVGNIVDSALGYFENKGIGNKYTSNFACALAGAVAAVLLLPLF